MSGDSLSWFWTRIAISLQEAKVEATTVANKILRSRSVSLTSRRGPFITAQQYGHHTVSDRRLPGSDYYPAGRYRHVSGKKRGIQINMFGTRHAKPPVFDWKWRKPFVLQLKNELTLNFRAQWTFRRTLLQRKRFASHHLKRMVLPMVYPHCRETGLIVPAITGSELPVTRCQWMDNGLSLTHVSANYAGSDNLAT